MWDHLQVFDADSHVMEPLWLWPEFIDPSFRDSCLRTARDPHDGDRLMIEGRPSSLIRRLGGVAPVAGSPVQDWNHLAPGQEFVSYRDSCTPASWDGGERLALMDRQGVDRTFLFPSLGLIWPRETHPGSPYALAHFAAYNRWLLSMAGHAPKRLLPVAQLGADPELPHTLRRLADAGYRDVLMPTGLSGALDRADPFFTTARDLDLTVHVHKVAVPHMLPLPEATTLRSTTAGAFFNHVNEILPGQLFLAALFDARVPDRYPDLRFVFHECNAGWLPAWLDRADESWETLRTNHVETLAHRPSDYLGDRDTFFFSVGLGEDLSRFPGEFWSRLLMATDYPHPGTPTDARSEWTAVLEDLAPGRAAALAGENAGRIVAGTDNAVAR
jgi:predicted TIM-barrel fold metal-dependent hydrolase